ncbi:MAG: hypothetical protein LLG04_02480 [Parachlamydia sp.]|nr:hypothetical protein [Parachlamydia sp.]
MRLNIFKFLLLPLLFFSGGYATIEQLSLEEKVGQLLIVHFHGLEANDEARKLISEAHVGGFIYYNWANGLDSPSQVIKLSTGLQRIAAEQPHPIPLWICTDQEGGPVTRLGKDFPIFPGNREIGQKGNASLARRQARKLGILLRSVGINMNLAPVVDISLHPESSFMTKRTYGDDPATVTAFAEQALKGYQEAGIVAVLKHFPGCGDVFVDPHYNLPILTKSREELEKAEWIPFRKLAPLAKGIMTTHLMVPALDCQNCATLSHAITTGILREDWKYEGLILSDSLVMQGLLQQCPSIEEAAIRAIEAGCDLLILGGRQLMLQQNESELEADVILRIHQAIADAVRSGRLPLDRLDASVKRNLLLKQ